jgi:hypothetical protein
MASLVWSPLIDEIAKCKTPCKLLVAPFIQADALKHLLSKIETQKLQVITSWTAHNLASGVSDPNVFELLNENKIPLYSNSNIHLKLFVFDHNIGFHTSGNITSRGLGLSKARNIEIGCRVRLNVTDWLRIHEILNESSRITDSDFQCAKNFVLQNKKASVPLPPLDMNTEKGPQLFSRQSLPQSESPETLWSFYITGQPESQMAACVHDLSLYKVPITGLEKEDFFQHLKSNFEAHPFIEQLINMLKTEGHLRFGAVNEWITKHCKDRPTPSRWELKPTTKRLYTWLSSLIQQITWEQPNYSQILYWNDNSGTEQQA